MYRTTSVVMPVILFMLTQLNGCAPSKPSDVEELKNFGMMYYNTQAVFQQPPTEWEQIFRLVNVPDLKEDHDRLTRFKNAGYTIVWGVDTKSAAASSTVLCYSGSTLREGGPVLFADGSVIIMSAAALADSIQPIP